jgi:hypothetical protein
MVIDTYIIYESIVGLLCYIIGGVGVHVSPRHNGLSVVRIRGSSYIGHGCDNHSVWVLSLTHGIMAWIVPGCCWNPTRWVPTDKTTTTNSH